MVLYIDVLLAVNWVLDFLLLQATARLLRIPHKGWRVLVSAALGAVFCCAILLPPWPAWLSVVYKLVTAAIMVGVAFGFGGVRVLMRRAAVLFLLSTAAAGVSMGIWWLLPSALTVVNGVVYWPVSPLLLVGSTAVAYTLLCLYDRVVKRRTRQGKSYTLQWQYGGTSGECEALYDSGNRLCEPFSGMAVAVVPWDAVENTLSPVWHPACAVLPRGARPIPYSSVGGKGVLAAFCPDSVTVVSSTCKWDVSGIFLAVSDRTKQALLGPAIFDGEARKEMSIW